MAYEKKKKQEKEEEEKKRRRRKKEHNNKNNKNNNNNNNNSNNNNNQLIVVVVVVVIMEVMLMVVVAVVDWRMFKGELEKEKYLGVIENQYIRKMYTKFRLGITQLKCPGRASSEDFQSDTSGETTASDSGRGGSEEDIQLPPLPEMTVDTSRMVFAHGPEALLKERRFMYTNTPPPEGEKIAFETFSPRMLPSYGNHLARDLGQPTAFRDVHTLGSSRPFDRKNGHGDGGKRSLYHPNNGPRSYNPYVKETSFGGKRVTFKNDLAAQKMRSLELSPPPQSPMPPESSTAFRGTEDCSPGFGESYPGLHRGSHDDDDNTTTSGSYTLNLDDDIDDLPPPISYSVA
ncbi:uncharacterized protein [Littorina saxatilis]|uniref:uncharacterized protein n=1 Tax=Littorina saxatilis TaxID=31220 RepID=UPI0038B4926D